MVGFNKMLSVPYYFQLFELQGVEIVEKFYGLLFKYKIWIVHTELWDYRGGFWKKQVFSLRLTSWPIFWGKPLPQLLIVLILLIEIIRIL